MSIKNLKAVATISHLLDGNMESYIGIVHAIAIIEDLVKNGDKLVLMDNALAIVEHVSNERDAALRREVALTETLERWLDLDKSRDADKEAYAQNAIDLRKRVDALQALLAAADERADVLEGLLLEARQHHGVMLMSDPPQDAWKYHRMNERIDEVIRLNTK